MTTDSPARWPTLAKLAKPFPRQAISTVTVGGGRTALYVSHADTTAAALARYGPHSVELVELIHGDWPETTTGRDPQYQRTWPAGTGVVGAVVRLTLHDIDGRTVTITEVGDCPQPGQRDTNGHRAQIAYGNAYRRAWSRVGLGLGLWRDDPHGADLAHAIARDNTTAPDQPPPND